MKSSSAPASPRTRTLTSKEIWRAPIWLGVITVVGLLAALFSDGVGDGASWLALAVPSAVSIWFAVRPARDARSTDPTRTARPTRPTQS
ncbi:hypothetical protein [Pendulispora albinea]|uniref:Uncharacterized protein n=1 Tax=Pendulispora albinea TaxID=2741071 RepID=A0ABZ2M088_9BACT